MPEARSRHRHGLQHLTASKFVPGTKCAVVTIYDAQRLKTAVCIFSGAFRVPSEPQGRCAMLRIQGLQTAGHCTMAPLAYRCSLML